MKTILYARRSRPRSNGSEPDTTDSQLAVLERYADEQSWTNVCSMPEHASAYKGRKQRVLLGEIVPMFERHEADRLVVLEVDRLGRNVRQSLEVIDTILEAGGEVCIVNSGQTLKGEESRLALHVSLAIAEEESRVKSDRNRRHRQRMREAGKPRSGGLRAYGFNPDGTIRASEAAVIKRSADMLIAGQSLRQVTFYWWDKGIQTAKGTKPAASVIRRVLLKSPLLDAETKQKVTAILTDPSRKFGLNQRVNLLSSRAYCGDCGTKLSTYGDKGKRKYVCRTEATSGQIGCGARWDAVEAERQTLQVLRLAGTKVSSQAEPDFDSLAAERDTLESRMREAEEAYAAGEIDRESLRRIAAMVREKLEGLNVETGQTVRKARQIEWVTYDPDDVWTDSATFDYYSQMIRDFTDGVELHADKPPTIHFR